MADFDTYREQLRASGAKSDADIDLAETALILAALDRPDDRIDDYREHLESLADSTRIAARHAGTLTDKIDGLRDVVFEGNGYRGDAETYDDMRNANLMCVIDRRRGLPVALGILCIHAARAQGWDMVGINFPSHFLLCFRSPEESLIVDPFDAVRVLDRTALSRRLKDMFGRDVALEPNYCRPVGNRDVLMRLQNNIRLRALRDGKTDRALTIIERMILLAPEQGDLRLEFAVLQAQAGNLMSAIRSLQEFLDLPGDPDARDNAAKLLRSLKSKLN